MEQCYAGKGCKTARRTVETGRVKGERGKRGEKGGARENGGAREKEAGAMYIRVVAAVVLKLRCRRRQNDSAWASVRSVHKN